MVLLGTWLIYGQREREGENDCRVLGLSYLHRETVVFSLCPSHFATFSLLSSSESIGCLLAKNKRSCIVYCWCTTINCSASSLSLSLSLSIRLIMNHSFLWLCECKCVYMFVLRCLVLLRSSRLFASLLAHKYSLGFLDKSILVYVRPNAIYNFASMIVVVVVNRHVSFLSLLKVKMKNAWGTRKLSFSHSENLKWCHLHFLEENFFTTTTA